MHMVFSLAMLVEIVSVNVALRLVRLLLLFKTYKNVCVYQRIYHLGKECKIVLHTGYCWKLSGGD